MLLCLLETHKFTYAAVCLTHFAHDHLSTFRMDMIQQFSMKIDLRYQECESANTPLEAVCRIQVESVKLCPQHLKHKFHQKSWTRTPSSVIRTLYPQTRAVDINL
jgi:hypothetical protein